MKKVFSIALVIASFLVVSCNSNGLKPCTDCVVDSTNLNDTVAPVDPTPGEDTVLSPVDSLGGDVKRRPIL